MKQLITRPSAAFPFFVLLLSCAPVVLAQDSGVLPTAKVLLIAREFTRPGKDRTPHEMTEAAFVSAAASSKLAPHYYAATSISGTPRALFFYGYSSFAEIEAENKAIGQDAALGAALDSANVADGDLLSSTDETVWIMRDEMSFNPGFRVGARFDEISSFQIKPGHQKDWEDLVKMVVAAYKKSLPEAHWAMYEEAYGSPGDAFILITTLKSGADIDKEFASGKLFEDAMGPDGMKKLGELSAACIESEQSNLFEIAPKMSHPPEAFVKAEPDFWKPKQAMQ